MISFFTFTKFVLSVLNFIVVEKEEIIVEITKTKFQIETIEIKLFCSKICIKNFKDFYKFISKN